MFFRFGIAVLIVVAVALLGNSLESRILATKRRIAHQSYRIEAAREEQKRLTVAAQQQGASLPLLERVNAGELPVRRPLPEAWAAPANPLRRR